MHQLLNVIENINVVTIKASEITGSFPSLKRMSLEIKLLISHWFRSYHSGLRKPVTVTVSDQSWLVFVWYKHPALLNSRMYVFAQSSAVYLQCTKMWKTWNTFTMIIKSMSCVQVNKSSRHYFTILSGDWGKTHKNEVGWISQTIRDTVFHLEIKIYTFWIK